MPCRGKYHWCTAWELFCLLEKPKLASEVICLLVFSHMLGLPSLCHELAGSLDVWVFTPLVALQGEKRLPQLLASQRVLAADLPQLLPAVHHGTGGCTGGCLWPGSAPGIHRVQCSLCLFVVGIHVTSSTVLPKIQEGFFSTKLLLATAVALWSAVGAHQEVLGEHRVMLEQGLCCELGLNSQAHKVLKVNMVGLW